MPTDAPAQRPHGSSQQSFVFPSRSSQRPSNNPTTKAISSTTTSFFSHSNSNSTSSTSSHGSRESRGRFHSCTNAFPDGPMKKDRDLPPLPIEKPSQSRAPSPPRRPTHRPTTSGGSVSQLPATPGTRNFSRPSPALRVLELAESDDNDKATASMGQRDSGNSSGAPSLSLSNVESDFNADSPMTPLRPVDPVSLPPQKPSRDTRMQKGREQESSSMPDQSGMLGRLRHAASASSLGRGLSRRERIQASHAVPPPDELTFLPYMPAAAAAAAANHDSLGFADEHLNTGKGAKEGTSSVNRSFGEGRLRGRKSSFGDLRNADQASRGGEKLAKVSFWSAFRPKSSNRREPVSAPPASGTSFDSHGVEDARVSSRGPQPRPSGSKLDRLLGHDEDERRYLTEERAKVSKGDDDQHQVGLETNNSDRDRVTTWRNHTKNGPSASSNDSFMTFASGSSRISDKPPTLDSPIGFPSRELSDDIEAVLRSQRRSIKGVEDILSTHQAIVQAESVRTAPLSLHYASSASSQASSPMGMKSFLPSSRAGHCTDSSISSSEYSYSTRSRSTSVNSSNKSNLRWRDASSSGSSHPQDSQVSHRTAYLEQQGQFEDAADDPSSPAPFAISVNKQRSGEGKVIDDVSAADELSSSRAAPKPMLRTASEQLTKRPLKQSEVQERAIIALDALPPLSTLHKACLIANQNAHSIPWPDPTALALTRNCSQSDVPLTWPAFVSAYARGDLDLSNPPKPPSESHMALARGLPIGIGLDVSFPLPPARPEGSSAAQRQTGHNFGHSRNQLSVSKAMPTVEASRELHLDRRDTQQAHPLSAGRAPHPPFEEERQRATSQYLSALGFCGRDSRAPAIRSTHLLGIIEELVGALQVSFASVQLVSVDDVVFLARTGHHPGEEEEMVRTPRANDEGALGLSLFERRSLVKTARHSSLDAHTILSKNGAPVVIEDLQRDWRFKTDTTERFSFYAAVPLLSANGLPVGTVSVCDGFSRPGGLARDERASLINAGKGVMEELERMREESLRHRLAMLDHTLVDWANGSHTHSQEANHPSSTAHTPAQPQGIEVTLLSAPAAFSRPGDKPPLSPNTLAQRRGAKAPANLALANQSNFAPSQCRHSEILTAALRSIASALQMDVAYVAKVSSLSGADCHANDVKCSITVRHDSILSPRAEINPDGPLHMCALAAAKRGLHLQQDPSRVAQLLGQDLGSQADASWGRSDRDQFHTAAVVNCGLKEGGKTWRGTEGWVLAVASRDPMAQMAPESTIFLLRFASLLAPILLDGSSSPMNRGLKSPRSANGTRSRTSSNGSRAFSPGLPLSPHRPRSRMASPGSRRILPPTSPPPNEPLPLLPTGLASRLPIGTPMDRSVSSEGPHQASCNLRRPPAPRRAISAAVTMASAGDGVSQVSSRRPSTDDPVEYLSASGEASESEASASFDERDPLAVHASFLTMHSSKHPRPTDMLRTASSPVSATMRDANHPSTQLRNQQHVSRPSQSSGSASASTTMSLHQPNQSIGETSLTGSDSVLPSKFSSSGDDSSCVSSQSNRSGYASSSRLPNQSILT
ncbi:unnamed protein product [Sympodiomycopsis kandeliae]